MSEEELEKTSCFLIGFILASIIYGVIYIFEISN
jgi:hypothetical protein